MRLADILGPSREGVHGPFAGKPVKPWKTRDELAKSKDKRLLKALDVVKGEPILNWIADPFSALINAMCHQQIGFAAGAARFNRLHEACGGKITPAAIARLRGRLAGKEGMGFTPGLEEGILAVADAVQEGVLDLSDLEKLSEAELAERLRRPYIGPWTIDFFRLYHLHDGSVLLETDVSLLNAIQAWYGLEKKPGRATLREMARAWGKNVAAACWFIYKAATQLEAAEDKPAKKRAKKR
jgi:3-methyladenine DNA glycosylase/8-oxoguanine DNA glycosylase